MWEKLVSASVYVSFHTYVRSHWVLKLPCTCRWMCIMVVIRLPSWYTNQNIITSSGYFFPLQLTNEILGFHSADAMTPVTYICIHVSLSCGTTWNTLFTYPLWSIEISNNFLFFFVNFVLTSSIRNFYEHGVNHHQKSRLYKVLNELINCSSLIYCYIFNAVLSITVAYILKPQDAINLLPLKQFYWWDLCIQLIHVNELFV